MPFVALLVLLGGCASVPRESGPRADHHQHVFSPAFVAMLEATGSPGSKPILADELIALLDTAGIRRAVLLSAGYSYQNAARKVDDRDARMRAENDWTRDQAARHPGRLVSFCGVNPLVESAIPEIERCARDPKQGRGIKMHFGNSDVQLENPAHRDRLKQVFRVANQHRMALVIHTRASISQKRPYGAEQARGFLEVLAAAPDIPVQVAHFAGSGPGYNDPPSHEVMAVLAEAVEKGDPRTRNLWFDVASIAHPSMTPQQSEDFARRIRQVGVSRVLYGTDAAAGNNLRPREAWEQFQKLPLTKAELAAIADNTAPYLEASR